MGKVHIIVMENTLQIQNMDRLQFVYDLKGSKVGRFTKGKIYPGTIQKDVNLITVKNQDFDFKKHELTLKR
jgi:hypothetical protein